MFHRVKSETEDGQDYQAPKEQAAQPSQPAAKEEPRSAEVTPFKPAAAQDSGKNKTTETQANTSSKPSEKDSSNMTEQQNNQADQTTTESIEATMSPYQRAGQAPVRAATTYPGAYPGYATGSTAGAAQQAAGERRLTIGAGITMSGEIESCDYLLVEGTVEAALKGANVLDIAESGTFYGTVEIGEANIAGRFEGDITVHGRLNISATGTVTGTIVYKELEIEAGAIIDGKMTPLGGSQAAAKKPAAAKPRTAREAARSDRPEPANSDGELFSKAAAAE